MEGEPGARGDGRDLAEVGLGEIGEGDRDLSLLPRRKNFGVLAVDRDADVCDPIVFDPEEQVPAIAAGQVTFSGELGVDGCPLDKSGGVWRRFFRDKRGRFQFVGARGQGAGDEKTQCDGYEEKIVEEMIFHRIHPLTENVKWVGEMWPSALAKEWIEEQSSCLSLGEYA